MTRVLGPDPNVRLVYTPQGTGLRLAPTVPVVIYADLACTVPADIAVYDGTTTPGASIPNSTVTTDANSMMPQFWFPADGTLKLYARANNGAPFPISADYAEIIEAMIAAGGGTVTSVNGHTGAVTLAASDVGADASGAATTGQTAAQTYTDTKLGGTLAFVQYNTGTSSYPLRSTVTASTTRIVVWVGPTAPTIGSGYAQDGVDMWFRTPS